MDMDNSVVIAAGEGDIRGLNGNEKNTIKIIQKNRKKNSPDLKDN